MCGGRTNSYYGTSRWYGGSACGDGCGGRSYSQPGCGGGC